MAISRDHLAATACHRPRKGPESGTKEKPMNFFDEVLQGVDALVQQNLGIFDCMGQNLFRALPTIPVVWYCIKAGTTFCENRRGFQFAKLLNPNPINYLGFA